MKVEEFVFGRHPDDRSPDHGFEAERDRCQRLIPSQYELGGLLGVGGASIVYTAHDTKRRARVAVKFCDVRAHAPSAHEMLRREAAALSELEHPSIVSYEGFHQRGGCSALLLEHLTGTPLDEQLQRSGPLRAEHVHQIAEQLFSALDYLHSRGLLHLDIKPENMIWDEPGERMVLIDLGLATPAPEAARGGASVSGTLPYMAPEQLYGDAMTPRTDLYQAAATLFELSTGRTPHPPAVDPLGLIAAQLRGVAASAHYFNPQLGYDLSRLIEECLRADADDRPSACEEILERLRGVWRSD